MPSQMDSVLIPHSHLQLSINGNTYTLAEAIINSANYTIVPNYTPTSLSPNTGETTITFLISDEIITRGQPNGYLIGGCVLASRDSP